MDVKSVGNVGVKKENDRVEMWVSCLKPKPSCLSLPAFSLPASYLSLALEALSIKKAVGRC
jgi:hypothetical protein